MKEKNKGEEKNVRMVNKRKNKMREGEIKEE